MERFVRPWPLLTLVALSLLSLGATGPKAEATIVAACSLLFLIVAGGRMVRLGPTRAADGLFASSSTVLVVIPVLIAAAQFIAARSGLLYEGSVAASGRAVWVFASIAMFYVLALQATNRRERDRIVGALFVVGVLEALYGVLNLLAGNEKLLFYERWTYHDSVTGTLVSRNHFAYLVEMTLPLGAAYVAVIVARARRTATGPNLLAETNARRALAATGLVVLGLAILLSRSRAGVACLLVSAAAVSLLARTLGNTETRSSPSRSIAAMVLVLVLGLGLVVGIDPLIDRYLELPRHLEAGRLPVWKAAVAMFLEHPFLGSGWGSFEYLNAGYRDGPTGLFYDHAHSEYLEIAAETGIVGLGVLATMIIGFFRRLARSLASTRNGDERFMIAALATAVLSVMLHSSVDFGLRVPAVALMFAWVVALFVDTTDSARGGTASQTSESGGEVSA